MDGLTNPPDQAARCPICGDAMHRVYVLTKGGIWFCESKEYFDYRIAGAPDDERDRMREINKSTPVHCVIGSSGYTKGCGTWPKQGLYCSACGTIAIKAKPY